jgi:hypothetical protein
MHATMGNKISAREREIAPRYYYKATKSLSVCQRLRGLLRKLVAFLFTQERNSHMGYGHGCATHLQCV